MDYIAWTNGPQGIGQWASGFTSNAHSNMRNDGNKTTERDRQTEREKKKHTSGRTGKFVDDSEITCEVVNDILFFFVRHQNVFAFVVGLSRLASI